MDNCTSLYDSLVAANQSFLVSVALSFVFIVVIIAGIVLVNHSHGRVVKIIACSIFAALLVYAGYSVYRNRVERLQDPQYVQETVEKKVQREIRRKEGKRIRYFQLSRQVRREVDSLVTVRLAEINALADTAAYIHDDAIAP